MTDLKDFDKNKMNRGDFIVLGEILEENPATIRARIKRGNSNMISIRNEFLREKKKFKQKLKKKFLK